MHAFAAGPAGATALLGGSSEPPVSPDTIGRAPSNFEAPPVPVVPIEDLVRKNSVADAAAAVEQRRVVLRFAHGDELEMGTYDDRDAAHARAKELVGLLAEAEAAGDWPEIDGRHLRPAAIVSIDVLVESA
ncbi:MAG TPA: hypothetical protein VNT58_04035 [Gaiellaceae bacterium]|nr:hypothetical protein [Gaiellaceae bacterium]